MQAERATRQSVFLARRPAPRLDGLAAALHLDPPVLRGTALRDPGHSARPLVAADAPLPVLGVPRRKKMGVPPDEYVLPIRSRVGGRVLRGFRPRCARTAPRLRPSR